MYNSGSFISSNKGTCVDTVKITSRFRVCVAFGNGNQWVSDPILSHVLNKVYIVLYSPSLLRVSLDGKSAVWFIGMAMPVAV